jgi:hypothetical protein
MPRPSLDPSSNNPFPSSRQSRTSSLAVIVVTAIVSAVCTTVAMEGYRQYWAGGGGQSSSSTSSSSSSSSSHLLHTPASPNSPYAVPASVLSTRNILHAQAPPSPPQPRATVAECKELVDVECEACPDCPAPAPPAECPPPAPPAPPAECPPPAPPAAAAAAAAPAAPAAGSPPASCPAVPGEAIPGGVRPPSHREPPKRLHKRPPRRPPPELERNECIEVDPYSKDLHFPLSAAEGRSVFNSPFSASNSAFEEFTGEVLLGECNCPLKSTPDNWRFDCGDWDWRILSELTAPWHRMNFTRQAIDTAYEKAVGNVPPTYHFAIKDGKLWRKQREPLSSWGGRLADMLKTVTGMLRLPDVEFSVNYFDHSVRLVCVCRGGR